jgi:uncharacterized protein YdeI (YjbR/CyaY-like superfamily)
MKATIYFNELTAWKDELHLLRNIILDCNLIEELKWKTPCYTYKDKNILLLGKFKEYCSISFFKGVLLKDDKQILCSPGENSQSVRMIKFTDCKSIEKLKKIIQAYIYEAIEIEESDAVIDKSKSKEFDLPQELLQSFAKNKKLKTAFESLTIGRQRAYTMFIDAAKQSETKIARIEKYTQRIIDGYGINDCTCGLSKRMPNCDGSHKNIGQD